MKFKICWNNDIRIFNTESDDWNEMLPAIRQFVDDAFGIQQFNACYIDEEEEKITISRTSDLKDALNRYRELNKIPKLYISVKEKLVSTLTVDGQLVTTVTGPRLGLVSEIQQQQKRNKANQDLKKGQWLIEPSQPAMNTINKIRAIVDQIDMSQIPSNLEFISIAIGDPTKFPNLLPSQTVTKAVQNRLLSQQANGYQMSYGGQEARIAISKKYSLPHIKCTPEDIILASGCSDALNMSICSLLNEGDNFLIPKPGFAFYETLASRYGFKCKFYNLLPDKEWQIDIQHLRSLIDKRTKAILINNPSNPCGSVLTEENLLNVLKVAENYSIPIVSDEIYDGMVYDDNNGKNKFYSVASLTKKVPILTLSGLSKQYLVPGWRVGWIVIHDPIGAFIKVRTALQKLSTLLLGPNTLIQASIPSILFETPDSYYDELNDKLHRQSLLLYDEIQEIQGLQPIKARGAMYLMVKINIKKFNGIKDDIDFANRLLKEQAVLCLPGTIFNMPNYFRAVICPPPHIIHEIGKRMKSFCSKYVIDNSNNNNNNNNNNSGNISSKL